MPGIESSQEEWHPVYQPPRSNSLTAMQGWYSHEDEEEQEHEAIMEGVQEAVEDEEQGEDIMFSVC